MPLSARANGRRRPVEALVTDAHLRNAVAGVRGLGRAGIGVVALAPDWSGAGLWSRYCDARVVGPGGLEEEGRLTSALTELVAGLDTVVLYPGREEAVDAVVNHRDDLPPQAVIPYSGPEGVHALRDKRRLAQLAERVGLGAPRTLLEVSAGELAAMPDPPVPCSIKKAHPDRESMITGTLIFDGEDELRRVLGGLSPGEQLLVQERLDGPVVSLGIVVGRGGEVVAAFQSRYHETWRIAAGSASWSVSVEPDPDFIERAGRMLSEAGYWGLAEMEFIEARGELLVIDVNPRYYGSMPLATACGVNLPAAWHAVALGRDFPAPGRYPVGVSYRWLEADVAAFFNGYRRRLLRRAPRPCIEAFWAQDDPVASALLWLDAAAMRLKGRLPGARRMITTRVDP